MQTAAVTLTVLRFFRKELALLDFRKSNRTLLFAGRLIRVTFTKLDNPQGTNVAKVYSFIKDSKLHKNGMWPLLQNQELFVYPTKKAFFVNKVNSFTRYYSTIKSRVSDEKIKYWVAGFIEGEGSTNISFKIQKNMQRNLRPCPSFSVTQLSTRVSSLELVKETLGGIGRIYAKPGKPGVLVYEVTILKHLQEVVIPFLDEYNCYSARKNELYLFKTVVENMLLKKHLTREGLEQIIDLVFSLKENDNRKHKKEDLLLYIKL